MKGNVRCLILDYGCVISQPQDQRIIEEMAEIFSVDSERFLAAYFKNRSAYDQGCTAREYWSEITDELKVSLSRELLDKLVLLDCRSWTNLNQSMLDFAERIKPNLQALAVLSNMPWDHLNHIRVKQNWFLSFDKHFFSCEMGICKPEPEIYLRCLNKLSLPAKDCLFVDDSRANTEAAASLGFLAHYYTGFQEFMEKWEGVLVS